MCAPALITRPFRARNERAEPDAAVCFEVVQGVDDGNARLDESAHQCDVPQMDTGDMNHSWTSVRIDGQLCNGVEGAPQCENIRAVR